MVPTDVQLLDGKYLSIDQSALTGKSLPVTKMSGEVAYANTIIKQGEMLSLVVNTISAIGWTYALYIWGYALAWFVFNDGIKMFTYRILRKRGMYT